MFELPMDWPKEGPIDLKTHDVPHASSDTEWWYFNTHVTADNNKNYSIFACFFRKKISDGKEPYSYSAIWAFTDQNKKQYYTTSYIEKDLPQVFMEKLKQINIDDKNFKTSIEEFLKNQSVPSSDNILFDKVIMTSNPLKLKVDNLIFEKKDDNYFLHLSNPKNQIHCTLKFIPQKLPVRHGNKGIVSGIHNEQMFYYFISNCKVQGTINLNNKSLTIVNGKGWYDHEFGIFDNANKDIDRSIGWHWFSIQLSNNYEISIYWFYDLVTKKLKHAFSTIISPSGVQDFSKDTKIKVKNNWKSLHTFSDFPVSWQIQIPEFDCDLQVDAEFSEQEFMTILSYPSFWEGRCNVKGTFQNKKVTGLAYVEQTNMNPIHSLEEFFSSVSREVSKEIEQLLPLNLSDDKLICLIASKKTGHIIQDIDSSQILNTIVKPIRTISDRAGKRWRSYALAACCHLVGGDFQKYKSWLAVPELIHTGSLIIDDIQDKSTLRRGGPSCHTLYGEPHAINAGTSAYFLFQIVLNKTKLSLQDRCKIYDLYFDTFRAAHAGQAIDIEGHLDFMGESIKTKNFETLQKRILAAHRLKSAVPAANLARMGAVLGHGNDEQITMIGNYFEKLGLAFQIMDDVLNLRGFKNHLKILAEDIIEGKVTYPIAKALEFFESEESTTLFEILSKKSKDLKSHQFIIEQLESKGVFKACADEAQHLVDSAWEELNPVILDSYSKMMIRAFSYYVINRHY